jgi:hypothetical protein
MQLIREMKPEAGKPGLQFLPTPIDKWRDYTNPS